MLDRHLTTALLPSSLALTDYDRINIILEFCAAAYNCHHKSNVQGDIVFRFPDRTIVLRTNTETSCVLANEPPKTTLLDLSFRDPQALLDILKSRNNIVPLLIKRRIRINNNLNLRIIRDLFNLIKPLNKHVKKTTDHKNNIPDTSNRTSGEIRNIVVFQGSPRLKSGYTEIFLDHLKKGLAQHPVNIEVIYVHEKRIEPCLGCYKCWFKNPGACIINDDTHGLLNKFAAADLIVLASPMHILNFPTKLSAMLSRLLPLVEPTVIRSQGKNLITHPRRNSLKKQYLLGLTICTFPDKHQFVPINTYLDFFSSMCGLEFMGNISIPGANLLNDAVIDDRNKRMVAAYLEEIGADLINTKKLNKRLVNKIIKIATAPFLNPINNINIGMDYLLRR